MPSPEAIAAHRDALDTRRFVLALVSRSSPFTMILVGANAAMFLVEWLAGGMGVLSADQGTLLALGAKNNDLILGAHQYWRLVTCIFLHIGFAHLLLNNYALWIIGQEIERLYGSSRFVLLYTLTGIVASLSSFYFSPNATSAGASGAIFGLFGVMAAFAFRYRHEIPNAIGKSIRTRVITIIALNLLIGFQSGIVDNAAHIGGLLSGAVLAMIVPYKRPEERITPLIWRGLQCACLIVMLVSLGFAFRNFKGGSLSISNLATRPGSQLEKFERYFSSMNGALNGFMRSGGLLDRAVSQGSDESIARAKRVVEVGVKKAELAPNIGAEAESYRTGLLALLRRQREIIDRLPLTNDEERKAYGSDSSAIILDFGEFKASFDAWAPVFIEKHGFSATRSDSPNDRSGKSNR